MKRSPLLLAAVALLAAPVLADAPLVVDLIAGQHEVIGTVTVEDDGTNLYVTYDADWALTETHLYVSADEPRHHAPGRFPYGDDSLDAVSGETYVIPLADLGVSSGDTVYVAAHAVAYEIVGYEDPDVEGFNLSLPEQVNITSQHPGGGDSYWDVTVSNGGDLDGDYEGWCVDTDRTMSSGTTYTADVYSSLDEGFDGLGLVEHPENMGLVNWIINQGYVGDSSPAGGVYTYGDVQRAIWTLIEDNNSTAGLGSWDQDRVDEILADAAADGADFTPGCEDTVAVLLVPVNSSGDTTNQIIIAQVTFIEVGVPCDPILGGDETAWADGPHDFRRSWAMYMDYTVCGDGPLIEF